MFKRILLPVMVGSFLAIIIAAQNLPNSITSISTINGGSVVKGTNVFLTTNADGTIKIDVPTSGAATNLTPWTSDINGAGFKLTNAVIPSYIASNQGQGTNTFQWQGTTNSIILTNNTAGEMVLLIRPQTAGSWLSWGNDPSAPLASIYWNPNHPFELQFNSSRSVSFNIGGDSQNLAVLQLGTSGATHERISLQYDKASGSVSASSPIGYGKPLSFANYYWDGTGLAYAAPTIQGISKSNGFPVIEFSSGTTGDLPAYNGDSANPYTKGSYEMSIGTNVDVATSMTFGGNFNTNGDTKIYRSGAGALTLAGSLTVNNTFTAGGNSSITASDGGFTYTNKLLTVSNLTINGAKTATTVVNLGLDANNNVVTNVSALGGSQTPWAQDIQGAGFSALNVRAVVLGTSGNLGSTNGTISITNAGIVMTPNSSAGITMGSIATTTASQPVLQMNGRTNRWGKLRANLLDETDSGLTTQGTNANSVNVDQNIFTMGGKRITGEIPAAWTNTANLHTNLFELLGTNGGFAKFGEDASLVINAAGTNGMDTLQITNWIKFNTNYGSITSTSNPTNQFTTNVLYTNFPQRSILIGTLVLNSGVSGSANITINYTNNGSGFTLPSQAGSGVSTTDNIPFSIPLSTNATFIFVPTMGTGATGYITNTVLWQM